MRTPIRLPALYPIADASLPLPLEDQVRRLGLAGFSLVQVRAKGESDEALLPVLRGILAGAAEAGGWPRLVINDRADLAEDLAADGLVAWGLHLGQGDEPPSEARRRAGLGAVHLGTSTHGPAEWGSVDPACDHAGLGPFRATATKGDHAAPIGEAGLRAGCAALRSQGLAPVAIGGLGLADAEACFRAGAESLAMIGAVHGAEDPAALGWEVQLARWRARRPLSRGRSVVLLGPSGAGKSTLGPLLAQGLGLPFLDLDEAVQAEAGRSIPDLFAHEGEAAFRAREAAALPRLLASPAVVSLGGGAWESEASRRAVAAAGATALWLAEPPEACWARVAGDPDRPLAGDRGNFLARCRHRMEAWALAAPVSSFGRPAAEVAAALLSEVD